MVQHLFHNTFHCTLLVEVKFYSLYILVSVLDLYFVVAAGKIK